MAEEATNDPFANTDKRQGELGITHDDINPTQKLDQSEIRNLKIRPKVEAKEGENKAILNDGAEITVEQTVVSVEHTKAG